MTSVLQKRMRLRSADFQRIPSLRPNTFLNQKSALRSRIFFVSTEVMHRPRSDSSLHMSDIKDAYQILSEKIKCYRSAFASRNPARALAAGLPHQDLV